MAIEKELLDQLDTSTKVLIEAGSAHVDARKGWSGGG